MGNKDQKALRRTLWHVLGYWHQRYVKKRQTVYLIRKKIFSVSRRNFDSHNYNRDMQNARNQAGFFNKSTEKGSDTLSYYGQNYVDALPDRDTAKQLSRPKTKSPSKKKTRKKK